MFKIFNIVAKSPFFVPVDNNLYIILPYFNYCAYSTRYRLFLDFINRIKYLKNIRIIITEGLGPAPLPTIPGIFRHLKFEVTHQIWIKESLINAAIFQLPPTWKYISWIDADIQFNDDKWVEKTIEKLNTDDVIQLFRECDFLGPTGEVLKVDKSFAYLHNSGAQLTRNHRYGHFHPGYAWACTRKAYEKMGGLVDWGILGSSDNHLAHALIGMVNYSYNGLVHDNYKRKCQNFQNRCDGLKFGFVDIKISHFWHGSIADRKYQDRWLILVNHKFNPEEDIYKSRTGIIQLTNIGKRILPDILEYFKGRNEDN